MKVCAIQFASALGDRARNMKRMQERINCAMQEQPDVLVLPELWDLGFYPPNALALADEDGNEAQQFLQNMAKKHHVNIVGGSILRRTGASLWNTGYVYDRQGNRVACYDKIHLFSPSGENHSFKPGNKTVFFTLDDIPSSMAICYDIRFCELARMVALAGAHILFVVAAWPHTRLNHWRLLTQARAVENQFFVVAANACTHPSTPQLGGHSIVLDPWGNILAEAGEEEENLFAMCPLEQVTEIRKRINIFQDRRPELYTLGCAEKTTPRP